MSGKRSRKGARTSVRRTAQPADAHTTTAATLQSGELRGTEPAEETPIVVHQPGHDSTGAQFAAQPAGSDTRDSAQLAVLSAPAAAAATPPATNGGRGAHPPAKAPAPVSAPPDAPDPGRRAYSLDALRGLFLVLMTAGFTIQGDLLPDWMYHRQFPPPGELVDVAGLTWRDLAFAAFIFTMAAALPITLARKIDRGVPELGIVFAALKRGFMLMVFALLIGHSNTYFIGYTQTARVIAVVGFAVMFALFLRPPPGWSERTGSSLRLGGWIAAVAFLALSPLAYGEVFSFARHDEVIRQLAVAVVTGSVAWYFTRNHPAVRLGVLAAVVILYLGARGEGWLQQLWWDSPASWLVKPSDLSLLTVVIPGTLAGDLVLRWMRAPRADVAPPAWSGTRALGLALLATAFAPLIVIGFYNRWVAETAQLTIAAVVAGAFLVRHPGSSGEQLLRRLFLGAGALLAAGVLLEPFEGGIRKVPETLSYFFTVGGITMMLLVALTVVVDVFRRRDLVRPLIDVGQNPMLCYVLFSILLNSLLELAPPLRGVLRNSAGEVMLRSLLTVIAVVLLVQLATRRKLFWRT